MNDTVTRQRAENAEYKRLAVCIEGLSDNKRTAFDKLLRQAAFLSVSLDELRQMIREEGLIETYQNGPNQHGQKASTAVMTYDKLLNTYSKVIAQISRGLPEETINTEADDLMAFIDEGRKLRERQAERAARGV